MDRTSCLFYDNSLQIHVQDVAWGDLDALIIDTPPGTSDEHITVMESLRESATDVTGAVLVTTPQAVAVGDVRCARTAMNRFHLLEVKF